MSFLSFRYFLVVAEELNISRAAQKLYITQQTLSAHIQKLEDQYGVRLFERKPTLKLTYAGEQLAQNARRLLEIERQMNQSFVDITTNRKGQIRIGITRTIATVFMPIIWEHYHELHPNVSFVMVEDMSSQLAKLLAEDKIDLYLGGNAPPIPNTETVPLATETYCCLMSKQLVQRIRPDDYEEFWANAFNGVDLLTLRDFPFIMLPPKNGLRIEIESLFAAHNILPQVAIETSQIDLITHFCRKGIGISCLAKMYLTPEYLQDPDSFYCFPLRDNINPYEIRMVYKKRSYPQYITDFFDVVRNVFREHS